MIGPSGSVRVYLACGPTDMRKGFDGLAAAAQEHLRQDPCSGAVFAFRGKRGDRVKLLWCDGQGFCLFYKRLERGRFRSEEHTSELQSLMRISYAVFCLKKKTKRN